MSALTHIAAFIGGNWIGATVTIAALTWIETASRRHNQHLTEFADAFTANADELQTAIDLELWSRELAERDQ